MFEIYFSDLTPECQRQLIEYILYSKKDEENPVPYKYYLEAQNKVLIKFKNNLENAGNFNWNEVGKLAEKSNLHVVPIAVVSLNEIL